MHRAARPGRSGSTERPARPSGCRAAPGCGTIPSMLWIVVVAVVAGVFLVFVWPPTPRALGRLVKRLSISVGVLRKAKHNRTDFLGYAIRRPALFIANNIGESAQIAMNGVDPRLKVLA